MKIGIVGDLHLKEKLGYSDYVADARLPERAMVLDHIAKTLVDCNAVVLMGDNFNNRNNSSETIREMVEFLQKFNGKELYILSGNHEKTGDGKSAIDFLGSLKNPNWHVITSSVEAFQVGDKQVIMLPYLTCSELGKKTKEEALKSIMKSLPKADLLFTHFAISDTEANTGFMTDYFNEIVLPKKELENKYEHIFAGHIHKPQIKDKVVVTGSIFNNEIGETQKYIYTFEDGKIEQLPLPGRGVYKFENPSLEDLSKLDKHNIVKVILTDKKLEIKPIADALKKFDAYLLLEQYPNQRTKVDLDDKQAFDFSIQRLMIMYSEAKKVDIKKLNHAMELISK